MAKVERPIPAVTIAKIDATLAENTLFWNDKELWGEVEDNEDNQPQVFQPLTKEVIVGFSNRIHSIFGTEEEKLELSSIKDAATKFLLKKSVNRYFPNSADVRTMFKDLVTAEVDRKTLSSAAAREKQKGIINYHYIMLRDRALSDIFSVEPKTLPENIREEVLSLRERYDTLKVNHDARYSENT